MNQKRKGNKQAIFWASFCAIFLIFIIIISRLPVSPAGSKAVYWPTQGWRSATPEEQGCDSAKIAEALQAIRDKKIDIHSLLIIRNGMVITDAAFYPYDGKTVHDLASVTKSMMTTLIAIAAEQGKLSLDQPMVSFFPERNIANRDERKERITVRHLCSMTSGLESLGHQQDEGTLRDMQASEDWVQFALDRKVVYEPGTTFVYDSPGMHLLSAILQQATGMTALEFARQNLFGSLGISEVIWPLDPQGYNHGWGDMYLKPQDMAKLGYLWLNKGLWEGKQIVSRQWVEDSVKLQVKTGENDDYGYGWWVMSGNFGNEYAAIGRGGQRVQVIPALDLMIVTTGGGYNYDEIMPFLEPALVDPNKPLPPNPQGVAELNAAIAAVVQAPAAQDVAALPAIAKEISGKTYDLEPNPLQMKTMRLDFNDTAEATIQLTFTDNRPTSPQQIGLDGVYRLVPGAYNLPQGMRGYWADDQTFVLEYDNIAANDHINFRVSFQGMQIIIKGQETAHELGITIQGRQQET
jgi:CubicO group peptidase (beta-lactamase class C family)